MAGRRDSVQAYLRRVEQYGSTETLDTERELQLARQAREGDRAAAAELVRCNQRLVVKLAIFYSKLGLDVEDLMAEANLGLFEAIRRFEPERGFRLVTFAVWWMRAYLNKFVRESFLVRLHTADREKLKYAIEARQRRRETGVDTSIESVAADLEMPATEVAALLAHSQPPVPLDDERVYGLASHEPRADDALAEQQEVELHLEALRAAIAELPEREREIVRRRALVESPETLRAIGDALGKSREWVRLLEERALKKVRAKVRDALESGRSKLAKPSGAR